MQPARTAQRAPSGCFGQFIRSICGCCFEKGGYSAVPKASDDLQLTAIGKNGRSSSRDRRFTIADTTDSDIDLDELLGNTPYDDKDDETEPQRVKSAMQLVQNIADALSRGDFSNSYDNQLRPDAIRILFQPIGVQGLEILSHALCDNHGISLLEIGIAEIVTAKQPLTEFQQLLRTNTALQSLSLWGNSIDDEGVAVLVQGLKSNKSITSLSVNNNDISDKGMEMLAEFLRFTTCLKHLDVSGNNRIQNRGAEAVAEALRSNSTLLSLNLSSNSIGSDGAVKFAVLFSTGGNSTLQSLDLSSNLISDDGMIALALSSSKTPSLSSMNIHSNMVTTNGRKAVVDALRGSRCIVTLDAPDVGRDTDATMF